MSRMTTQTERVRELLEEHGEISARALLFEGITRVAARVWELRREGYNIETIRGHVLEDGTHEMARYRLLPKIDSRQVSIW